MAKGQKVGYIRVSSVDQNIARQLEGLELDKKFIDKLSGKNTDREQFIAMISYVREGDEIYVHSMDRLARNLDDLRKTVNILTKRGVSIHFIKENLVFKGDNSAMSNLVLSIMGAFAEFERDITLERQREGIRLAQMRPGYKCGRPKILNKDQEEEIKQLLVQRIPKTQIAKQFNMHRTTLYGYIKKVEDEWKRKN